MRQVRLIVTSGVFLVVLLAGATLPVHGRGNRCTDHCADRYRVKKDACGLIPFKHERKICERRAKEAKNDCKHRCH
jgi:hypothetical protein